MTGHEIYEFVKYWLPITTVLTLAYKAYTSATKRIADWANTLFDNHLTHIQDAVERTGTACERTADAMEKQAKESHIVAEKVGKVADDLEKHEEHDNVVQHDILTALEVLRDRG